MSPQLATSLALSSPEFGALPFDVQDEVHTLLGAMARIHAASRKSAAILAESHTLAGVVPCSPQTLERKYYAWRGAFDWRVLVNRAKAPKRGANKGLPEAFVAHWHSLYLKNQRKAKPAYRQLIRDWMAGKPIPGYQYSPLEYGNTGHPEGWDYTNLMKGRNKPTPFEEEAARKGRDYAAKFRPQVLATRVGLAVGEILMFDDMWHDFKVWAPGQRQASRIVSLHGLDLFSGCLFASGHKPTLFSETADGKTKREQIGKKEMTFFLAHVLSTHGFRGDGCRLIAEHGTAAISKQTEAVLARLTDDKLQVTRSGIVDKALVKGMFAGSGKGNFRIKAALESLHNLIHNETADMVRFPMQTGSNSRLNAPTGLYGQDEYVKILVKAIESTAGEPNPPEVAMLPLEVSEAVDLIYRVYDLINSREDHKLEGWEKAKLMRIEWRLDMQQQWQDRQKLLALEPQRRAAIEALISSDDRLVRCRRMTPGEVYQAGQAGLKRFSPHQLPQIFGEDLGEVRQVGSDNLVSFWDAAIDPEEMFFGPYAQDQYGEKILRPGDKFLCYCNPWDSRALILCDAKGGFHGLAPRVLRAGQNDAAALQAAFGRAAKTEMELLRPVVAAQRDIVQAAFGIRKHNARLFRRDTKQRGVQDPNVPGLSDLMSTDEPEEAAATADPSAPSLKDLF